MAYCYEKENPVSIVIYGLMLKKEIVIVLPSHSCAE